MKLSPLTLFILWFLALGLVAGAVITLKSRDGIRRACNGVTLPVPEISHFIDITLERKGDKKGQAPIHKIVIHGDRRIEFFGHEKIHRPMLFEAVPSMTKNITPEEMDMLVKALNEMQFTARSGDTVDPGTCRASGIFCDDHAQSSVTLDTFERQHAVANMCGFDRKLNELEATIDRLAYQHGMDITTLDICDPAVPQACLPWLQAAAAEGYKLAQTQLGFHYAKGIGVPQDNIEAYKWLKLGNREEPFLKWITPKLSDEELYEAKARFTNWRPTTP